MHPVVWRNAFKVFFILVSYSCLLKISENFTDS